jgi:hypothetical protein
VIHVSKIPNHSSLKIKIKKIQRLKYQNDNKIPSSQKHIKPSLTQIHIDQCKVTRSSSKIYFLLYSEKNQIGFDFQIKLQYFNYKKYDIIEKINFNQFFFKKVTSATSSDFSHQVALTIVIHFAATTNYMFYSEKESNMI